MKVIVEDKEKARIHKWHLKVFVKMFVFWQKKKKEKYLNITFFLYF